MEGYTTDRYTSGALASDEDIANFGVSQDAEAIYGTRKWGPLEPEASTRSTLSPAHFGISRPGFTEGDYTPLSSMRPSSAVSHGGRSAPRTKRRILSKPGKVMKPAYFEGIQWTRVDRVHNKYTTFSVKFVRRMCLFFQKAPERSLGLISQKRISEKFSVGDLSI